MPGGVDGFITLNRRFCYYNDFSVFDTHIGYIVKHGFRVHDPAVIDHNIVIGGNGRCGYSHGEYRSRAKRSLSRFIFILQ